MGRVLSGDELKAIDAYWRAANYLSADARTTSDPGRGSGRRADPWSGESGGIKAGLYCVLSRLDRVPEPAAGAGPPAMVALGTGCGI